MTRAKIASIAAWFAVVALGISAWHFLSSRNGESVVPPPADGGSGGFTLPPSAPPSFVLPAGPEITVGVPTGNVRVKNFYPTAVEVTPERNAVIRRDDAYEIYYASRDSSFVVLILAKPFAVVRPEAERAFLDALGLTERDACRLQVSVAVPYDVDPALAGQDFRLSFCGKPLQ